MSTASRFSQHWRVGDDTNHISRPEKGCPDSVPLCVDLDGTLLNTDMLWESLKDVSRKRPWSVLLYPFWLLRGRACLKQKTAARATVDIASQPFHHGLLEYLKDEKRRGRTLILTTASDRIIAGKVADYFGIFDGVIASDGSLNLRGPAKAAFLVRRFGLKGFDYAGNSPVDLHVWRAARSAIVVNGTDELLVRARRVTTIAAVFPEEPGNPCRTPW